MRQDEESVHRIAILAHEAATEPAKWNQVVRAIARCVDATGAALFTRQPAPDWRALAVAWGSTADAMQPYLERWAAEDPWEMAMAQNHMFRVAGEVRAGSEIVPTRDLHRTSFYNDFARSYELEVLFALKIFDGIDTASPITQISLFRPPGVGEFSGRDKQFLAMLSPHLRRALRTCWSLRQTLASDHVADQLLDNLPQPIWVLTSIASIVFANAAARQFEITDTCVKTRGGVLSGIGDFESDAILSALKRAGIGGGGTWIATFSAGRSYFRAVVRVAPLSRESACGANWPQAAALLTLELPAPRASQELWLAGFAGRWHLTHAELRVLEKLAAGSTPPELSRELALSYATVRSHLQSIFNKTGCRRQTELIRLLGSGPFERT